MRLRRRESFNAVDRGPDYLMLIDKVPSMAASQDKMQRRIEYLVRSRVTNHDVAILSMLPVIVLSLRRIL